ncbi:MAG: hypothetical protein SFU27_13445 [Thermonemataceae bacterium]|nr:hypothetical protein [Thermonemataceae bacterium]
MTSDQKKALLLLEAVIFNYHGLDEEEKNILEKTAKEIEATEELKWVNNFIAEDSFNSFERARGFLNQVVQSFDSDSKISCLTKTWNSNKSKGYVSEIEATSLLKIAKDWGVQKEFITFVRNSM